MAATSPHDIITNFKYSDYTSPESNASLSNPTIGQSVLNGITRAIPNGFKNDAQTLSDFRLGSFLRDKNLLNGDQASILNGLIDLVRSDAANSAPKAKFSIDYKKYFIPIIIKTQFNINRPSSSSAASPFYIVFDSTPESINFNKSASWTPVIVYGRPEPIQVFATSSAITFSLTGTFFSVHPQDHAEKLKLADRLFALTTPSKYHMMPSPVEITIGEWKRLRCIVNDVKVEYKGPWWIQASGNKFDAITRSVENQSTNATTKTTAADWYDLKSHSPYIYEATFSFTVISEINGTQYAEDIMKTGWNGGFIANTGDGGLASNTGNIANLSTNDFEAKDLAGHYKGGGILVNNEVIKVDDTSWSNLQYLQELGLPIDASGGMKSSAMNQITTGLTASITGIINNKFGTKISKMLGK